MYMLHVTTCIALLCVWATLLCSGCPSFIVEILLSLTVTGFPFYSKEKKSSSGKVKTQPFQHCFLWAFHIICMPTGYFTYVTPQPELVADLGNEFGTQLHKIWNFGVFFPLLSNSSYFQISLFSKDLEKNIGFPRFVYSTGRSYSDVYTVHIFNLLLVFRGPYSKFHLCHLRPLCHILIHSQHPLWILQNEHQVILNCFINLKFSGATLIYISWEFNPKSLLKVTESFLLGCLSLGKIMLFTEKLLFGRLPYVTALLAK